MTECEKLAQRFQKMASEGLLDVKFHLRNAKEAAAEQICREVNNLYDAIDKGEYAKLDFKRSRLGHNARDRRIR